MTFREDLAIFEQMTSAPVAPIMVMNPRDYAVLKEVFACGDWLYKEELRLGRRIRNVERRWMEAKFYKKKCLAQKVDPIPFPEDKP